MNNMVDSNQLDEWIKNLFASIDGKNTAGFTEYLSDEVQFQFGNMPAARGKLAVAKQVDYFFDSIKSLSHHIFEYWLQEQVITCHGAVTYTRHDDSTLTVPFANIFRLNQQGISQYLIFADVSALYQVTDS